MHMRDDRDFAESELGRMHNVKVGGPLGSGVTVGIVRGNQFPLG